MKNNTKTISNTKSNTKTTSNTKSTAKPVSKTISSAAQVPPSVINISGVNSIEKDYDAVPYDSHAFAQTHPQHLRSIAKLFGLNAPELSTARVLELGCASGGNLLSMAYRHPQTQFVGIDLSSKQIEQGKANIAALGLNNLQLQHRSISDLNAADGLFDYIICHGVYSWVPPEIQHAILSACQNRLSPTGVAYISYNTYPGWKAKEMVRDAMLYRAKKGDTPEAALSMAKGMVDFLANSAAEGSVLKQQMLEQRQQMSGFNDSYLQHEFLEQFNQPCYFEAFINKARSHQLEYLSETEISTIYLNNLGGNLPQDLFNECGHDQIAIEQYMDYLRNRTFRQTLLVHRDQHSLINYNTPASVWMECHYQAHYTAHTTLANHFVTPKGTSSLPTPWHQAVAQALTAASPATLSAHQLLSIAQATESSVTQDNLIQMLSQQTQTGTMRFRCEPVIAASSNTILHNDSKPCADDFIRTYSRAFSHSSKSGELTNVWHEHIKFIDTYSAVLSQCDGEHTIDTLDNPNNVNLNIAYQHGLMLS